MMFRRCWLFCIAPATPFHGWWRNAKQMQRVKKQVPEVTEGLVFAVIELMGITTYKLERREVELGGKYLLVGIPGVTLIYEGLYHSRAWVHLSRPIATFQFTFCACSLSVHILFQFTFSSHIVCSSLPFLCPRPGAFLKKHECKAQ